MSVLGLEAVWTVTAVLLGFQTVAFSWRIQREIQMAERKEPTGLALGDYIILISITVGVVGVFIAPILGWLSVAGVVRLFGLSTLLFASSLFVLAGHYNLYGKWNNSKKRPQVTRQELIALGLVALPVIVYTGYILR